ncbi:MAG: hypothetical protein A3G51_03145 [Candidatus Yanofskybacteria bacterium RIFCSPLOWO2_12_FULL_43_11b]|uniref:Glycosyltransferase RgtA/B/C/D-like domain-containing protein n=1 Tax=Candidatus Yanofskybacteria bacterium RIFCSPLOWO2_12_FULL_43_11b TaxID=1802710 RepID=A0A1F8HB79_9BACT|nr:MAG: hypothetical protein A2742_00825 [Candidatus Yanofskybacteria bacterium RIFCSPHIGHO2_01_FULL_43_32]OGN11304.1 MAG: hypothetical protein A3C69_00960 [Candidatus Yanofskybacteria bacterium RIFCSPHIGHO2_02_FULL_43_12]OGN24304.1 MAG: hypothetical protein A2923_00065 [Candidatus Yanofskybacteria bacterium RIFCSPLOWO2_01_FULL_43_46]OGN34189.1 MAG: hypothetical protein A3G51_03145 [Candidatus Yanofskybacteria bacterium RIFCSPLOWO2_12_FULL_43_11b]
MGMLKTKKQELAIFLIIVGVAAFFRLYQLDTLRISSATVGILTVIGLYFLVKELFEWRLAAIASFLTATSFWHVNFSRMESAAIIIPFTLVYSFYLLGKGLKKASLPYFFVAGIFGGLGFYTNSLCVAPIITIFLFLNYWWYLKKDFSHDKYEYAKTKLLQGFVVFAFTIFIVALPLGIYFWQHQEELLARIPNSLTINNVVKTLGMFNFTGDWNPAHNTTGSTEFLGWLKHSQETTPSPMLPWPIGVFFAVGFINEFIHWLKRKHGHFSTAHTLLFAWFFVTLIPGFLSATAPDALLTIGALPVVMIFTARGIWWFFNKLSSWYGMRDTHSKHEAHAITALVMIIFLFSVGFMEYWRYFK